MKRHLMIPGILALLLAVSAAANTAPTITAASPITMSQGDPATSAIIATVSDAEDSAGSLTVTATSVPNGITVASITNSNGSISAYITAACDASSSNNIVLQVEDSGGLTATATFQVLVHSTLPPAIPTITATTNGTGTSDQACPEQPLTLTASSFPGVTSYQWYKDGGAIDGATSRTYSATSAGSYTATESNECYTSAQSFIPYVVQNPTPHRATIWVLSESTTVCAGSGGVTLWSDSATGIQWYNNGTPISGANSETFVATESGSYTVILNALGCHSQESDPVVVTVSPAPNAPAITAGTNGTGTSDQACPEQPLLLVAHDSGNSSLTNYQWYLGNDAIDGATSNQYSATAAGDYSIVATLNGCSARSNVLTVQNPAPHKPVITVLSESTTICTNPGGWGVQLEADSATGIQWYNNGFPISGANNQDLLATESGSYTCILNALGCHSEESDPVIITVNVAPETPVITATQNGTGTTDQACPEQPLVLTANDSNPSSTSYQWFQNNDTIQGATDKTYSATGSGDYTVTATSPEGCTMRSDVYSVQNPTPHAPFISFRNQDSSVTELASCTGSQIIDSDSATGIQWYRDGVAIPGANSQSYTATISGTYTAQLNALGCHSQFGRDVTLTVGTAPSKPVITATENGTGSTDQACPEVPLTLTASSTGATSYQWYKDIDPLSGETSATYQATGSATYYVVAINGTCSSKSDGYVVQNPTPHAPFVSFRNQDSSLTSITICQGNSVTIDSDSATGIHWWKDGVDLGPGSQSLTVTQSGVYTAQLNALGCHSQFGRDVTVTVADNPSTPTITATENATGTTDQACPEQPLVLTATSAGATSYQWYSDNAPLSGETNSTYTATGAGNFKVVVTNDAGCSATSDYYVVQNPTPHAPFISARSATTFCAGGSVILDSDSATGIQWYKDGVAISGATHQSYTATESGSYNAQLNALGCHSQFGTAVTVTVSPYPATPAITGATNGTGTSDQACPEQPLTLTATSSGATSFQWYRDDELLTGETGATLTVTAASSYSATATNGTCTTPRSSGYAVQNPTPHSAFLSARSATTFCQGGSVIIDSDSATGIQWYKDGVAVSGGTSYTATASGSYTVILNALGCHSQTSNTIVVTVNPYPATPAITASGATTFCAGGSVVLTSSSASGNQWYLDGTAIAGATSQSYTATTSGSYTVVVTTSGCSSTSAATTVTVNPYPTATITANGPTSFCNGGSVLLTSGSSSGNQWYLNSTAISGATSQSYTATAAGVYTVIVTSNGCSTTSAGTTVTVNANPSATITAPTSIIYSGSTGNSASVASAATYSWSITNGTITSGAGTNAITFTAGSEGTLTLSVTVTTSAGCSDTKSANVSVVNQVTVTSIKATSGSSSGGTSVTIRGTNFESGATVTFGGVAATDVVVKDSTKIQCTTPAHAAGDVDVVVTNTNTSAGALTAGYKYKKN